MSIRHRVTTVGSLDSARKLSAQGKVHKAWTLAVEAITLRPFHPEAYLFLAELAEGLNDLQLAIRCVAEAEKLAFNWPKISEARGRLSDCEGKRAIASDALTCPQVMQDPRLSICMIVKDEERFIKRSLESVHTIANQLVVVDTGSRDRTVSFAEECGAEVYEIEWNNDFSGARNDSLQYATGDWVLILDADEIAEPNSIPALRAFINQTDYLAGTIRNTSAGPDPKTAPVPRLFRNVPGAYFTGRIHEQVFPSLESKVSEWGMKVTACDFEVVHYGYLDDVKSEKGKVQRNLKLLAQAIQESPDDPALHMHYAIDLSNAGQLDRAIEQGARALELLNGCSISRVSPDIRDRLLNVQCNHLLVAGRFQDLITVANSPAALLSGPNASVQFMNAIAHMSLGDAHSAIPLLESCIEGRNQPVAIPHVSDLIGSQPHILLGNCYARVGQLHMARQQYEAVLVIDPDNGEILRLLKALG
ncbi:MAG: glycosyltransferase [Verrucomicrobiota bacterium]|jgi:tetratricopeptide (TPR) repeat protein|nr:glycosyltransferase [Verrucomicrobiota bacterium]